MIDLYYDLAPKRLEMASANPEDMNALMEGALATMEACNALVRWGWMEDALRVYWEFFMHSLVVLPSLG